MKQPKKIFKVFAYSDINYDSRILKQCEALLSCGYEVKFHGVRYGTHKLKSSVPTKFFFKRFERRNFQYAQYIAFILFAFLEQLRFVWCRPTIIVHNMPNFLVLPFIFSKICGSKVILDVHDDSLIAFKNHFKSSTLLKFIKWLEVYLSLKVPHKLITVNRILEESLSHLCSKPISVIHNCPNISLQEKKKPYQPYNQLKLVYIGHLQSHYDLPTLINYVSSVDGVPMTLDIYGGGSQRRDLEHMVQEKGIGHLIKFHGRYLARQIPQILQLYDIGCALYEDTELTNVFLPVKILEYTKCGIPTFASKLYGTQSYFNDKSLMYLESLEDFKSYVNAIFCGELLLDEVTANALRAIKLIDWNIEKSKFVDYVCENA